MRLKVKDRVRIIDSPPERFFLLNHTGNVISIEGLAADENIVVRLDKPDYGEFLRHINFNSHHATRQLQKVEN